MAEGTNTVVLASGSPRRVELLSRIGVQFVVDAADVDEHCEGVADEVVRTLARKKAMAVAPRHPESIILAADTIVDCDGILGKPFDELDAARMLKCLSGRWHEVYTGVCVVYREKLLCETALTKVHFVSLTNDDIARYVATGEPMGKAGAYGIQGMAGMFIDQIIGCPHNVMGLPLALTRELLASV